LNIRAGLRTRIRIHTGIALGCLFPLVILPVCIVLARVIPPGESPDENAHVVRAASLLHGDLTGTRTAIPMPDRVHIESLMDADPGLDRLMKTFRALPPGQRRIDPALAAALRSIGWSRETGRFSAQTGVYPPPFYLPAAAGLGLGRWLGMLPIGALTAARIANALAAILIGAAAVATATHGRLLLLAMLATPMSLWLAASVHPDAVMLAVLALALAFTARAMAAGDGRPRWGSAMLLGCVVAMKPPLAPLAGLLLLPFARLHLGGRFATVAVAVAIGLAWTGLAQHRAAIPVIRGAPYEAGPLYPGPPSTLFQAIEPAAQLRVLIAAPRRIVTLPALTAAGEGAKKLQELVGVLGQLDLALPSWLYRLWGIAFLAAALGDMAAARSGGPAPAESLFVVAIALACIIGIYQTLYLTWTPVGAVRIEGVQGRYFLPLIGLAGLGLPALRPPRGDAWFAACAATVATVIGAGAAILPDLALRAYYAG
jgi:hypothetical protein